MSSQLLMIIVMVAVVLGLGYAALNFFLTKKLKEGNERMQEIAAAIREGANAFINYEYKIVAIIGSCIAVLLAIVISWETGVAFVIGAVMSATAGFIGMKIATYCNVRVTNEANETRNMGKTLKVAFRGGSVMGLCVAGFALLGILIVYFVFGVGMNMLETTMVNGVTDIVHKTNPITGQAYSLSLVLSGYALGCSIIAMFNRVGGGIYTKAADMGADLVGKTEVDLPEDDPRNPATIADNVGDNVGDVAGLGADLLESYVGAIMATAILAIEIFAHNVLFYSTELFRQMIMFPILFAGIGLIGCIIGISYPLIKRKLSDNPHRELNLATWISAGFTVILGFVLCFFFFKSDDPLYAGQIKEIGFKAGTITPWICAVIGIAVGIVIGIISEYYTSDKYNPTKKIAKASEDGSALTVTQGMATGMISCMLPVVCLGVAIFATFALGGMYGVGCGAMGMLSFVAATVSVDTYGPISDNAGGIAEMSGLEHGVREITDELDSVGNTTAAIGKGFAIGSAALATMSMMSSYLYSFMENLALDIISRDVLVGAIIGAALPFLFSGMLINAVANAAGHMVEEVRRQFKEIPGLREGNAMPDYKTCIEISSKGALKQMVVPAIIAIAFPIVCGFLFGAFFVGGLLIGATLSAIMLAIFTGNSGGAWDNAKKYIEKSGRKGTDAHKAAVVGDTVGDPLKDTVGPSLDILIKIMSTVSLVTVVVFSKFNVLGLLGL
ncbi:MAG: sodium-translocating pyrophosphatase [Clostridiales bacterium]|nr:sodium-translocating pyrophosphatase [Clostridiales bacterium]